MVTGVVTPMYICLQHHSLQYNHTLLFQEESMYWIVVLHIVKSTYCASSVRAEVEPPCCDWRKERRGEPSVPVVDTGRLNSLWYLNVMRGCDLNNNSNQTRLLFSPTLSSICSIALVVTPESFRLGGWVGRNCFSGGLSFCCPVLWTHETCHKTCELGVSVECWYHAEQDMARERGGCNCSFVNLGCFCCHTNKMLQVLLHSHKLCRWDNWQP